MSVLSVLYPQGAQKYHPEKLPAAWPWPGDEPL